MEVFVLIGVIVVLSGVIVGQIIVHYKERDKLINKIMSESFLEYSNFELSSRDVNDKIKKSNKISI